MQNDEERDDFGTCLACGAIIESTAARSYPFGSGNELCNTCAIARGGAYVVDRDVWDPPPDLSGLRGGDLEEPGRRRRV